MDARLDPDAPAAAPWYLALALDERAVEGGAFDPATVERGRIRFDEWRGELGLTERIVERRLATSNLTLEELHALRGEDPGQLQERVHTSPPPAWLESMLADLAANDQLDAEWPDAPPAAPLLALVEPFLAAGTARLRERLAGNPFARRVSLVELLDPIRTRLLALVERPLILELHAAALTGALPAGDPAAQFSAFATRYRDHDRRLDTLLEYPVLARLASAWVGQWVDSVAELFGALEADRHPMRTTFGEFGDLVHLTAADSDRHRGGRHVWILEFEHGDRLVYKPRPGACELAFREHVSSLVAGGLEPSLATLRTVDGGHHLWLEFAPATPVATEAEVREFHRRQGAWLAVLWTLACTDMHYENTIAVGAHPIPVDHETVLRNRVFTAAPEDADLHVEEALGDTIFGVDLLPAPRWDDGFGGAIDQGGMGAGYDDAGSIVITQVVDAGTADMRVGAERIDPDRQPNRASIASLVVDPREHAQDVEDGFVGAWRHLAANAEAVDRSLSRFEGAVVRMILRPTQNYLTLHDTITHPHYLQDALQREHALLQLWMYPDDQEWRRDTVESERRQLLMGDVPWFGARSGEFDIVTGDGATVDGGIVRTGLDVARSRIALLGNDATFERQLWVLRTSLAGWGRGAPIRGTAVAGDPIDVARHVVAALDATAIVARGRRSWLGAAPVGGGAGGRESLRFRPDRLTTDLYDGLAGVAMTLGAHAAVTGDDQALEMAREATATLLARGVVDPPGIGAYDGAAGTAWASLQLATWLDDPDLVDHAEAASGMVQRGLQHDRVFDVVSGAAGCIPVLIELDRHRPGAIELAQACGRHLIEHVTEPASLRFQRGFSHGVTGIAWALARLSAATGEARWLDHALGLVDAEDELLAGGNWTDGSSGGRAALAAWCHGAPGIALGRLELHRVSGRARDLDQAHAALEATVAAELHETHGLCHGELGTIDVLDIAARLEPDAPWRDARDERIAHVLGQVHANGPRCTMPRWLWAPGLMTGASGIAWGMLRIAAPDLVPSVLVPGDVRARAMTGT